LIEGEGTLRPGRGPVRTGVTVILPHEGNLFTQPVPAAVQTINGFGKTAGFEQVRELGMIESPIALTNTLNVGLVMDALVTHAIRENPEIGITAGSVNVVVGETNDGYLNDIQGRHVKEKHVLTAIENASGGPVTEGSVGAGTGTVCFGWKGGIGTASRKVVLDAQEYLVGTLVQTNFGRAQDLTVVGIPIGRRLSPAQKPRFSPKVPADQGSVMVVVATNAPLDARQLGRLSRRAGAGLARVGGNFVHGSGEFVIAFSTANRIAYSENNNTLRTGTFDNATWMDSFFRAVIESVEEAVLNSLTCAKTMVGRDGHTAYALPLDLLNTYETD
jgi:D-aminopeptidase